MYYGQRDKLISIRVSSELLNEAKKRIDSYTTVSHGRGGRNTYDARVPGYNSTWNKLSIADIFEKALKDFVANTPINPAQCNTSHADKK